MAWLNRTCGDCPYCSSDRENLCERLQFTGWTVNGGFAEYGVAPARFAYRIPEGFDDFWVAAAVAVSWGVAEMTVYWANRGEAGLTRRDTRD